jgi:hypothetical protein
MHRSPAKGWQKIALFYAIAGPATGSLVFTVAYLASVYRTVETLAWATVMPLTLVAAAMGIGLAFVPAFVVGAAYALLVVRGGELEGTTAVRVCLSCGMGLTAGAVLGVIYEHIFLFVFACGTAAVTCVALLEWQSYFDWVSPKPCVLRVAGTSASGSASTLDEL